MLLEGTILYSLLSLAVTAVKNTFLLPFLRSSQVISSKMNPPTPSCPCPCPCAGQEEHFFQVPPHSSRCQYLFMRLSPLIDYRH